MSIIDAKPFLAAARSKIALGGIGAACLLSLSGCYVGPAPGPVVVAPPPPPAYYAPAYAPGYAYQYPPYRYYGGRYYGGGGYYGGPAVGVGIRVR